ncbi:type II toxin-antitoxin system ParD family antitoxin [Dinoroseobacter sp. S76]|uniref:type II toxin-antitoxin system ParD family antitoxin n=1 Tax=Dinoroseobacter sp. S76 TaxID=3415124 RepID=UPI003C7DCBC2
MSRLTISVPDQMHAWVEAQVETGRYGNVSEYFRDLVRHDQERKQNAISELSAMLERAEAGGFGDRSMQDLVAEARKQARDQGLVSD